MTTQQGLPDCHGYLVEEVKGMIYPLNKQSLRIGRDRHADIRVISAEVSKIHGYIKVNEVNKQVKN
jgi:pSer/pThr/pTyr-binding forkhead associated (FHA) protein